MCKFMKATKFMRTNLVQWDNHIFLPKDEQRRTLQLIPVLSFTDDPCTASHKTHHKTTAQPPIQHAVGVHF